MKIFGYMRVSGAGQVEGDGFHRQREAIEEFIRVHGLNDSQVTWGREEGVSGTCSIDDRPLFAVSLAEWAGNPESKPDAIILERLDRFARDLMVQECAIRDLKRLGIKVFACDHGFIDMADDTTDPSRVLIRQVFGAIAQYDKSITVKKLRASRERIKAEGVKCEGRKYFGEVDDTEKLIRATIIGLRQAGVMFCYIVGILKDRGLCHPDGREISKHTCKRVWKRYKEGGGS